MSEIKKLKINGQEYTITDGGAVVFDEAQELNEEQKEQARENIGAGSGVYVLGEGETEADVPEDVDVLIDPNGDPLDISQPLIVTVTDGVANHTAREIIDHILAGGTAVSYWYIDSETYVFSFDGGYFYEDDETEAWVVFRCGFPNSDNTDQLIIDYDGSTTYYGIYSPTHSEVLSLINKQLGVIENGSY